MKANYQIDGEFTSRNATRNEVALLLRVARSNGRKIVRTISGYHLPSYGLTIYQRFDLDVRFEDVELLDDIDFALDLTDVETVEPITLEMATDCPRGWDSI